LTDYQLPGEIPLSIKRFYSTKFSYNGLMGYGWTFSYNERVYRIANGNLVLRRDNDVTDEFTNSTPQLYLSPAGKYETITQNLDGSYTLRQPDGTIHVYSSDGTLAKVENLKGYQLLFAYDAQGKWPINGISLYSHITNAILVGRDYRLARVDQARNGVPNGRYATFQYNADGRITRIQINAGSMAPLSLSYAYASNGSGDLVTYTDAAGTSYAYAYDNLHRMTNFPTGECACRQGQNIYDATNRVTRQILGNTVIDFEYLVAGSQTRVTTHIYDDQTLQLLRNQIEYFYFTASGKTSKHVVQMGQALDPANGESDDLVTTNRYSVATDELIAVDEPSGSKRVYTYDSNGNMASDVVTNGAEIITRVYQYDASSRLTNQYVTSTLWPGVKFGQQAANFDASGRVLWERRIGTNGTELATTYQYQTIGDHEIATVTDPEGNRMSYETDVNRKLVRQFDPDSPAYQTRFQYDDRGNLTNRIDALGYQTQYAYDELNRVIRETDGLGQQNIYTYTAANLVREEIGRAGGYPGRILLHDYNSNNKRTATYRVSGNATNVWARYGYDSDGKLIWQENAVGLRTGFSYDAAGRRVVVEDVYGGRTTNVFDKGGNLVSSRNALGVETRLQYDLLNRLTNRLEAAGTVSQRQRVYRLDPVGNLIETVQPDGTSTFYRQDAWGQLAQVSGSREYSISYQYDGNGQKIVVRDGNGYSTTNRYDKYGRLTQVLYPDGAVEQRSYDLVGNLVALTDGNTNTTYFTYDGLRRRVAESGANSPGLTLFSNVYNSWNELVSKSDLLGGVERRYYDAFGRLTNRTDAAGLSLCFQYDAADRLVATLWPNGSFESNVYAGPLLGGTRDRAGHWTTFGYDVVGRRIMEVTSLGLVKTLGYDLLSHVVVKSNSLPQVVTFDYDVFDNPVRITLPDGLIERVEYDAFGQVTNRLGGGQHPVSFSYDAVGNRTSFTDGNGNTALWVYDSRNRVQRRVFPDRSYYQYGYDKVGNLQTRRDGRGLITTHSYDAANRVMRVDYPTDLGVLFDYDALGRRTRMVDASGTNRWYYDVAGHVLTNTQDRANAVLVYEYDAAGNRTKMSLNGETTGYGYDPAGRLSVISNRAGAFNYSWSPDANLVQAIVYPNGAMATNSYNRLGWLVNRLNLRANGSAVSSFAYAYDSTGLRTNVICADGSRVAYGYDAARQLTSAHGLLPGGTGNPSYQFSYVYDPSGNRTVATNSGNVTSYLVNNLNQYTSAVTGSGGLATNTFGYDANGSLIQDLAPTGNVFYAWDQENRLLAVTNGNHRSEFLYNGLGFLVESREYESGVLQGTTRSVYDGFLPVAEVDGLDAALRTYVRGLDLSLGLDAAGGIGGLLALLDTPSGSTAHYFFDGNGNVVDLLSGDGNSAAHYEYDPFGNVSNATGPLVQQPLQWSTKLCIPQRGLVYFGQRWYGAGVGRWLSRDPIYDQGYRSVYLSNTARLGMRLCKKGDCLATAAFEGANLYAYARNDALNEVDYWGLMLGMRDTCRDQAAYNRCVEAARQEREACLGGVEKAYQTCMDGAETSYKWCAKNVCGWWPREFRHLCESTICGAEKGIQEKLCLAITAGNAGCWYTYADRLQSCREDSEYTVPEGCPCR